MGKGLGMGLPMPSGSLKNQILAAGRSWETFAGIYKGAIPPPLFDLPLEVSLVPAYANGSPTPSFTRATTGSLKDFEGILRTAIVGEARFEGTRRVQNLVPLSQVFAGWTKVNGGTGVLPVITDNFGIDPNGNRTAARVQLDQGVGGTAADISSVHVPVTFPNNSLVVESIWIKTNDGTTKQVQLRDDTVLPAGPVLTVTPNWQRFFLAGTSGVSSPLSACRLWLRGTTGTSQTADLLVWGAQLENTSGQALQIPGDFVSTGVLPTPYHGANVDGVKYFKTLNGNIVTGNAVTQVTGAAIPDATILGYLSEDTGTNLVIKNQDLSDVAWTKANATITVDAIIAPDGTMTGDMITDDAVNSFHRCFQAAAVTNGVVVSGGVFAKAGTGSWLSLSIPNIVNSNAWFNLTTGLKGTAFGSVLQQTMEPYANGWYFCSISAVATSAAGGIDCQMSSGNTISQYIGTGSTIYLWRPQCENNAGSISSSIFTDTVAVTRNPDTLSYSSAGNIFDGTGSIYAEISRRAILATSPSSTGWFGGSVSLNRMELSFESTLFKMTYGDGVGLFSLSSGIVVTPNVIHKQMGSYYPAGGTHTFDGTTQSIPNPSVVQIGANFNIGCRTAGLSRFGGNMKRFRTYAVAIPPPQQIQMTS